MGDEQRHAAKVQMMALMQAGYPWQEAANRAGIHPSRSTAYRWFQHFLACGEVALQDGRHGHVHKVHDLVLQWLHATCQATPHVSSAHLHHQLYEQLGVQVSITHLNRLLAAHDLTRQAGERRKNLAHRLSPDPVWHEGAGGLLLVAAAHETGLLTSLEAAFGASPDAAALQ